MASHKKINTVTENFVENDSPVADELEQVMKEPILLDTQETFATTCFTDMTQKTSEVILRLDVNKANVYYTADNKCIERYPQKSILTKPVSIILDSKERVLVPIEEERCVISSVEVEPLLKLRYNLDVQSLYVDNHLHLIIVNNSNVRVELEDGIVIAMKN